jgi:FkbM family methyltransferase
MRPLLFVLVQSLFLSAYNSSYLEKQFLKLIDKNEINFIIELGGYEFKDTLLLYNHYKCPIIVFEPNPNLVTQNYNKIKDIEDITLVAKGIWDTTGIKDFNLCSWTGASSYFTIDYQSLGDWNKKSARAMKLELPMTPISTETIRLDEFIDNENLPQVDLICMDVQGAALNVLKSLGSKLSSVKYIITEVEYNTIYEGEALFPQIRAFMKKNGFTCFGYLKKRALFNDVLFIRNDLCPNSGQSSK